ncbi:MAG: glycosyltransferase family 2 protein, partial [Chitinophagaceae bacterium]|nr:glycosyltransferase family 2 protein [Chitinophagaceae bacterium]
MMVSKSEIDILITIAIPNYNYGQYIGKTIESAIHQSGDDIEILISDNNSEDNSWEIIQSYVDSRIISFKQNQNIGLQQNWNFLLNKARGKYFILLPSD